MSYVINWSSQLNSDTNPVPGAIGKSTIIVADKTSDTTSTSLTLTGKGVVNYGQFQQENFIRLMENFASQTSPSNPTVGQQWYDTTTNQMMVQVGSATIPGIITNNGWAPMFPGGTGVTNGSTPPANPTLGQFWYNTTNNFLYFWSNGVDAPSYFGGWTQLYPLTIESVANSNDYANSALNGLANQLNKIVGAPQGTSPQTAFGWGQTNLAAIYTSGGAIQATADTSGWPGSTVAQAGLAAMSPPQIFQSTFNNTAWTELLARLREALRQIGQVGPSSMEAQVSPVGFLNDGHPTIAELTYTNFLNTPSSLGPYSAGFGPASNGALLSYFSQTTAALNYLSQNRFTLPSASNTTYAQLVGHTTTTVIPATSPTPGTQKLHTIAVTFTNQAAAQAYFNSGGNLTFNWTFSPTAPDTLNQNWNTFFDTFSGIRFDYQGIFTPFAPPDGHVAYLPIQTGWTTTKQNGFYSVLSGTVSNNEIFERDVQDSLGYSPYASDPPTHGGIRILATAASGANFVLTFTIQFDFVGTSDNIQAGINSSLWATYSNLINSPVISAPTAVQSGTFVAA